MSREEEKIKQGFFWAGERISQSAKTPQASLLSPHKEEKRAKTPMKKQPTDRDVWRRGDRMRGQRMGRDGRDEDPAER